MAITLKHPDGMVYIEPSVGQKQHIKVELANSQQYLPYLECTTNYPMDLIELILSIKGPAYLCDEILRDENPDYVELELLGNMLAYVSEDSCRNKRILDFGCGSGASSMIMARRLPQVQVVGVELSAEHLTIAQARLQHYKYENVDFKVSPQGDRLPEGIGEFDFVVLNAVYEHMLPNERRCLLGRIWSVLKPNGIIFINETPYRFWYREVHTTGLPLLNYLPDSLAFKMAKKYAKGVVGDQDWATLLRKGIRGGAPGEIMAILNQAGAGRAKILQPINLGLNDRIDLWAHTLDLRRKGKPRSQQFGLVLKTLKLVKTLTGVTLLPILDLAIQKT